MAAPSTLQYTPLPSRAEKVAEQIFLPDDQVKGLVMEFMDVKPRPEDKEGDTERIEGETFTHHFTVRPGDAEVIRWHYVETGRKDGEVVVFLHGIPDAWYQWHFQMAKLGKRFRCIAPDLKGYGQSEKTAGDYRHEGAAEQLFDMLQSIGVTQFNVVSHDRGTVQADFMVANHPENILRYARGEQHLFHYHPKLSPQGDLFMNAPRNGIMDDPRRLIVWAHASMCVTPLPKEKMERLIQEFWYPGIPLAVPRYFNSSTFRQEWLQRRNHLLAAWKCPVLILQGYESKTQPREFYEGISQEHIPNAKSVQVHFLPGGHFWPQESPLETTEALEKFFKE